MQETEVSHKENYFTLQMALEEKKHEYKLARRPLMLFRNVIFFNILIAILAIVCLDNWGNDPYVNGWCSTILWVDGIFTAVLLIHFFNMLYNAMFFLGDYTGENFGFQGIDRIKHLISLKEEIENLVIQLRVLKTYRTKLLTPSEQFELYKDELRQVIKEYQNKANHNPTFRSLVPTFSEYRDLPAKGCFHARNTCIAQTM